MSSSDMEEGRKEEIYYFGSVSASGVVHSYLVGQWPQVRLLPRPNLVRDSLCPEILRRYFSRCTCNNVRCSKSDPTQRYNPILAVCSLIAPRCYIRLRRCPPHPSSLARTTGCNWEISAALLLPSQSLVILIQNRNQIHPSSDPDKKLL